MLHMVFVIVCFSIDLYKPFSFQLVIVIHMLINKFIDKWVHVQQIIAIYMIIQLFWLRNLLKHYQKVLNKFFIQIQRKINECLSLLNEFIHV